MPGNRIRYLFVFVPLNNIEVLQSPDHQRPSGKIFPVLIIYISGLSPRLPSQCKASSISLSRRLISSACSPPDLFQILPVVLWRSCRPLPFRNIVDFRKICSSFASIFSISLSATRYVCFKVNNNSCPPDLFENHDIDFLKVQVTLFGHWPYDPSLAENNLCPSCHTWSKPDKA